MIDLIDSTQAAELLGIKRTSLNAIKSRQDSFPKPKSQKGRACLFDKKEIQEWVKLKNYVPREGSGGGCNLKGQSFSKLVVIQDTGERSANGEILWDCKCECGNKTKVTSCRLLSGKTKSCGCLRGQHMRNYTGI